MAATSFRLALSANSAAISLKIIDLPAFFGAALPPRLEKQRFGRLYVNRQLLELCVL
jgi:hypothetical protein